jgi:hypothetical protein
LSLEKFQFNDNILCQTCQQQELFISKNFFFSLLLLIKAINAEHVTISEEEVKASFFIYYLSQE